MRKISHFKEYNKIPDCLISDMLTNKHTIWLNQWFINSLIICHLLTFQLNQSIFKSDKTKQIYFKICL